MIRRPFFVGLVVVLAVVVVGIALQAAFDAQKSSAPPHRALPKAGVQIGTSPWPVSAVGGDSPAGVVAQVSAWVEGEQRREQELAEEAAAEAARLEAARRAANSSVARPGTSSPTECDGKVIPAYIIQRESGCNYGAVSPASFCGGTGCYGLYQIAGFHWNGGGCSDLTWTIPADQDECARRLSSDGTNLRPWGG